MDPDRRPPSVDSVARSLSGLPHSLLVDAARAAIAAGDPASAPDLVAGHVRHLLHPVVNATGVLLHTNLGRAPYAVVHPAQPQNLEFDLATGARGSRNAAVGALLARLTGAESAMVVNNNAAAVLLAVAALASGRSVAVSRGESVEIGGSFRIPEIVEQSGARLVDVGTMNKTRLADFEAARDTDGGVALVLKVHPSNYSVSGFTESVGVAELATLGVPLAVDLGSGLVDSRCQWLGGAPPPWLAGEPAAHQTLAAGADLVTFSGDKLFGGPQAGIIAGRAELIERCARHPLARALRPGGLVLAALQEVTLSYLRRSGNEIPFWRMATTPVGELEARARAIADVLGATVRPVPTEAVPGAGSVPGATIPSFGLTLDGDRTAALRRHDPPVIARVVARATALDLRSVDPADDEVIVAALRSVLP